MKHLALSLLAIILFAPLSLLRAQNNPSAMPSIQQFDVKPDNSPEVNRDNLPLPMHQTPWSPERPLPPPVSLTSLSHHEKPPEVTS